MSSEAGILLSNTDCAVLQDHCALLQLGKQGRSKAPMERDRVSLTSSAKKLSLDPYL